MKSAKLGLCLAGGGARGIAHIGALQAMQEANIRPNRLSGSSMGAIVGTLFAAGIAPLEILRIIKESSLIKLFRFSLTGGISDNTYIKDILKELGIADDFSALQLPLDVCITNLSRGRFEIVNQGELHEIVAASASIPILFRPRLIRGDEYVDGGVLNNLPVEPLKATCENVIGINVTPIMPFATDEGMMDIAYRTLDLVLWNNVETRRTLCDVLIEPDTAKFRLFDVGDADEIYQLGYEATQAKLTAMRALG